MLNKKLSNRAVSIAKLLSLVALVGATLCAGAGIADAATPVLMGTIAKTVDSTVAQLATVFIDVSLIAGIGFVVAAFFKFHQHKQNPQQVQMSQGISLLLIGCGLTLIPLLVPTGGAAVLGSKGASPAKVGGAAIHGLIGSGT